MARFRVTVEGGPVFLLDVESQKTNRLGFFTKRWIHAAMAEEARSAACRLALEDLAETGTRNPPNVPVQIKIEEAIVLS